MANEKTALLDSTIPSLSLIKTIQFHDAFLVLVNCSATLETKKEMRALLLKSYEKFSYTEIYASLKTESGSSSKHSHTRL